MTKTGRALDLHTPRAFTPLLRPARYKGLHGGRGSGKSHFFADLIIEEAIMRPGLRAVCVREVQRSLEQSVKRLIEDKIQARGVGRSFRVMRTEIETPGDGLIIFQGMQNHTAESIKSLEGYDVAWVEEAQSLSQRSLDLLRPTIRKPGSELWFSWNPVLPTDPVDALLRGSAVPPRSIVQQVNWRDSPWFPDVLKAERRYDQSRDPDKYAHVWEGAYLRNSEARVFHNWRVEDFALPRGTVWRYGADWGFSVDPTVLIKCAIDGRTLYVKQEAYRVGCEIDHTPELFDTVLKGDRATKIVADSARPETISYMRRQGFNVHASRKGAGSVQEGVQFLRNYDIVVHPRCRHTIDELTMYSYKTDPLTGEPTSVLEDRKNHVIDALRYAVESVRRAGVSMVDYL